MNFTWNSLSHTVAIELIPESSVLMIAASIAAMKIPGIGVGSFVDTKRKNAISPPERITIGSGCCE